MPGDDAVKRKSFNATRAITINAPPESVWPWIVQIGHGRAGFYSYDLFDNAGKPSADRIIPEYQNVRPGDWVPMASEVNERTAFKIAGFAPGEWMLWEKPDSTWAWRLIRLEGGKTRVVTRLIATYDWKAPASAVLSLILLEWGDFPMMRKLLLGVRERAERLAAASQEPGSG
jgi:hypothetical protein